jgi:predicted nucleotidyltransferase
MIPPRVQSIVDKIAQQCRQRFDDNVTLIWFGSWVKGNAYLQSDIDLAIDYSDNIPQAERLAFEDWLDEFPTLYSIDLVELTYADETLKTEISQYGKIL